VPLLSDRAGEQLRAGATAETWPHVAPRIAWIHAHFFFRLAIAAAAVDLFEWPELTKDVSVAGLLGLPD
jgi:hypothetical protein